MDPVGVKFKKINEAAVLPSYANEGDAGMDLYAIADETIKPGDTLLVKTGLAMELPKGTEAQVRPRSGLALKHSVTVLNTPGTIDCGYRGEIGVILINHGKCDFMINKGMRIAQLVVKPVMQVIIEEVNEIGASERGANGFGSSGA